MLIHPLLNPATSHKLHLRHTHFFFFQAEDGIRDWSVTGVQTCALPIYAALITGANSGIGLATAKRFVNEGAYVFITGRRDAELAAATREIERNVTGVRGEIGRASCRERV